MVLLRSSVERDLWLVFEGNVIVRLFSELLSVSSEAIVSPVDPYYCTNVPNDIQVIFINVKHFCLESTSTTVQHMKWLIWFNE